MTISLEMFVLFIAITLGITYWASRRSAGAAAYFASLWLLGFRIADFDRREAHSDVSGPGDLEP